MAVTTMLSEVLINDVIPIIHGYAIPKLRCCFPKPNIAHAVILNDGRLVYANAKGSVYVSSLADPTQSDLLVSGFATKIVYHHPYIVIVADRRLFICEIDPITHQCTVVFKRSHSCTITRVWYINNSILILDHHNQVWWWNRHDLVIIFRNAGTVYCLGTFLLFHHPDHLSVVNPVTKDIYVQFNSDSHLVHQLRSGCTVKTIGQWIVISSDTQIELHQPFLKLTRILTEDRLGCNPDASTKLVVKITELNPAEPNPYLVITTPHRVEAWDPYTDTIIATLALAHIRLAKTISCYDGWVFIEGGMNVWWNVYLDVHTFTPSMIIKTAMTNSHLRECVFVTSYERLYTTYTP